MIRVYVKTGFCAPCIATKRDMDKEGVDYDPVPLETVPDWQIREWQEQGHMEAPIVDTGTEVWSGYRPDRIKNLVKEEAA